MARAGTDEQTDSVSSVAGIVERLGERHRDFAVFFAEHHDHLERALVLTLGDMEVGRDATSEGFARALFHWHRVARFDNPAGWVYRTGLNWARSRVRRHRKEVSPEEYPRLTQLGQTVPDEHSRTNDVLVIGGALAQLSVEQRTVVIARYYLDWSEAEIADALGIRPGTVKSRSSRALSRIADVLRPDAEEDS